MCYYLRLSTQACLFHPLYLLSGLLAGHSCPFLPILFLPLLALPILGIYTAIAGFINKTIIKVDSKILQVTTAPLPWFGGNVFSSTDLKQLYIVEKGDINDLTLSNSTYKIMAKTRKGESVTILSRLRNVDTALYLEQQIEKFFSIKDEPVPGEMSREKDPLRNLSPKEILRLLLKGEDLFNTISKRYVKNIFRRKK